MQQVTLSAPDISCAHCKAAIDQALGTLPGVSRAETDVATKRVAVEYDPAAVSLSRIEAVLDDEGYPVQR